jgi:hypothetical protein
MPINVLAMATRLAWRNASLIIGGSWTNGSPVTTHDGRKRDSVTIVPPAR